MANAPAYSVGLHVGEVTGQDVIKASSSGNLQLVMRVKILGIPEGGSYVPHQQQYERTIFWTVTDKTVKYITEKLERLGFEGKPSQWHPSSPGHISVVGSQVDLWCAHEQRTDGKGLRERWDIARGDNTYEVSEPLSAKAARDMDMLFGKAKGSQPTQARAAQSPAAATATLTEELEDAPPGKTSYDFAFKKAKTLTVPASDTPPGDAYEGEGISDDDIPF